MKCQKWLPLLRRVGFCELECSAFVLMYLQTYISLNKPALGVPKGLQGRLYHDTKCWLRLVPSCCCISRACSTILVSVSSWSDANSLISCRDVSDDHTFSVSLKPPLFTCSRPVGALELSEISVERKWARLALLSSRMMNLYQFPILWSLLSIAPNPCALLFLAVVFSSSFHRVFTYLSNSSSTLVQLSEKWKVTLHSPKGFAPEELARD